MKISGKILRTPNDLAEYIGELKKDKNVDIVLCQGHFNVIHPGHFRFLEFAKSKGDYLIVLIQGNSRISPTVREKFFNVDMRARSVASLEFVDKVFIYDDISFDRLIEIIKPAVYVMGEEFSEKKDLILDEINIINKHGGKLIFSSGDVRSSSTEFLDKDISMIKFERRQQFRNALNRQNISVKKLIEYCNSFNDRHILVIGDTIVDQYVACDPLGMSSEAPVLVVQEIDNKEYVGGAAIVSRHVRALGAKCYFVSLVGKDEPGNLVRKTLSAEGIETKLVEDDGRPTTFKIRYMVDTHKLLRVSRMKDHHLSKEMEDEVIDYLNMFSSKIEGIIVNDFSYGMITPKILEHISVLAEKYNLKLFGDVQSSSQIGNVSKFHNYYLLTPTEKEARIALDDRYSGIEFIGTNLIKKTNAKNLVLTLSSEGFVSFQRTENEFYLKSQHFPALNPTPIDVVGAGDSLLTGMAVSSCAGADLMEASAIGAVVASIAVNKIGNVPITLDEVKEILGSISSWT